MKVWDFQGYGQQFSNQKPASLAPFPQQHIGFLSQLDPVALPTTSLDHRAMTGQAGASDSS